MNSLYKKLGVHIPEILLPAKGTNLTKWSVIACDQYTSQPEYWRKVKEEVGDSPSTLHLTFPEIYLKEENKEQRISNINRKMTDYLENGVLIPVGSGFLLVDRSTPHAVSRKGLLIAIDLECYDYRTGSKALVRATEGTVLDRIPPRVKIRENAPIELPHIMVLIDDPGRTVIEALFEKVDRFAKVYDFDLMQNGGHIRGWKVEDKESLEAVEKALWKLAGFGEPSGEISTSAPDGDDRSVANPAASIARSPLLFAVGDGNHSLASAKAHWENVKAALGGVGPDGRLPDHPARFALVELVNVHDEGLIFEPIHRVLFGVNGRSILDDMKEICRRLPGGKTTAEFHLYESKNALDKAISTAENQGSCTIHGSFTTTAIEVSSVHLLPFILEGTFGLFTIENPAGTLEVGTLQTILDELAKNLPGLEIDYIHGEQVVTQLGSRKNCMGFYLPVMNKFDLFPTVVRDGVLPKKTFSMGEAEEKRYYLECRRIR